MPVDTFTHTTTIMDASQRAAFEAFTARKNICITGPAGSGKSFLIRQMVADCEERDVKYGVTAMTGAAAVLLGFGAKTIHSWAGIGLGTKSVEELVAGIRRAPPLAMRWRNTRVLIIDEVSMLTAELFSKLDKIGRILRNTAGRLFGGIQLVLVGDFYQLPPIGKEAQFCFEHKELWDQLEVFHLNTVWRQADPTWRDMLNEIRVGHCTPATYDRLAARMVEPDRSQAIQPTKLFCRRGEVDGVNQAEHDKLPGEARSWERVIEVRGIKTNLVEPSTATDSKKVKGLVEAYEKHAQYYPTLNLKLGDQVMLLANLDTATGLANGSRGVVTSLAGKNPTVRFMNGMETGIGLHEWEVCKLNEKQLLYVKQIPLRLAYAITVHKSQGMTLDCAEIDIGASVFEHGQTYVALSRVKSLEGLYLMGLDPTRIKVDPRVTSAMPAGVTTASPPLARGLRGELAPPARTPVMGLPATR